jgi:hypothetical protein
MAEFERLNSKKHLEGLAEAARKVLAEELVREGRMPSFDQVAGAIDETRQKYRPLILAARQKKSSGSKRERKESGQAN